MFGVLRDLRPYLKAHRVLQACKDKGKVFQWVIASGKKEK